MKKNQTLGIVLNIVFSLFPLIYILSIPKDSNGFKVLTKLDFAFVVFLFSLSLLTLVIEIIFSRKKQIGAKIFKIVLFSLEIIFLDILFVNLYDQASIYLMIVCLFNILMSSTHIIINYTILNKKCGDIGEMIIPPFWYSYFSIFAYYGMLIILPSGLFCLIAFVKIMNVFLYFFLLTILFFIIFIPFSILISNEFSKICYAYEESLDYSSFQKKIKKIVSRKLNSETENYIKLIDSYYQMGISLKKGNAYFNSMVKDSSLNPTKDMYKSVKLNYLIFTKDDKKFKEEIIKLNKEMVTLSNFEKTLLLEKKKSIEELKELYVDHKAKDKPPFEISKSSNLFINVYKSLFLFMYYYIKKDEEKSKEYFSTLEASKYNLEGFYNIALEFKESMLIKEKSCGAVVYKIIDDKIYILLEHMAKGHTSIPKGHVENDETEVETALREIKEETNLEVDLDTSFRYEISYSPYFNCEKKVVFFIATPKKEELIPQLCEVSSLEWVEDKEAIKKLTFKSDKDTVIAALKYLNNESEY